MWDLLFGAEMSIKFARQLLYVVIGLKIIKSAFSSHFMFSVYDTPINYFLQYFMQTKVYSSVKLISYRAETIKKRDYWYLLLKQNNTNTIQRIGTWVWLIEIASCPVSSI